MFRSYLTMALRQLKRHKGYSFINVAGLAVGRRSLAAAAAAWAALRCLGESPWLAPHVASLPSAVVY